MKAFAAILFDQLKKLGIFRVEKVRGAISQVYHEGREQTEERVRQYYIQVLSQMLWTLLVMLCLGGMLILRSKMEPSEYLQLEREDYGGEESSYTLQYWTEQNDKKELAITLEPVRYREEELEQRFQEGFAYLESEMLGENKSLEQIQYSMNLLTGIPDSGLTVKWYSDDYELIDEQGNVNNGKLQEARRVYLQLELSYENTIQTREYALMIQPKRLTKEEQERQQLQQEIETLLQENKYEKQIFLPTELQGIHLSEKTDDRTRAIIIVLLGIGISGMLWFRKKEELQQKRKKQQEDYQRSYPYLVNQLVLNISAGATIQGAFERILQQYETGKRKQDSLYGGLKLMQNEMHSGVSREQAYIRFGKRTGLPVYFKLTALLIQQTKKGSSGLILQLEQEEQEAFAHQKERAKRLGEEAGTKLLFPMILLMLITIIIILCPTLINFYN